MQFETNKAKEHTLTASQNYAYEGFNVAWKAVGDVNNKSLTSAYGVLGFNDKDYGHFWFRSNCLNRFCGLGWAYRCCKTDSFATEASWDFLGKTAGVAGKPLFFRFAHMHEYASGLRHTI